MQYNSLGKSGLKISELSLGSWVTFGKQVGLKEAKSLIHHAFENGINFFDNAEVYAAGESEKIMGAVLKDFRREDLVVSTKIFWSGKGPNDTGLSRKHLIEATKNSLKRLQLDYVDLLYCHRPDPSTPIAETVMAMDYLVRNGYAFYWGTSEWSAAQIEMAFHLAKEFHCIPPTMEQPEYNMFHRHRVEQEYAPLYEKYGLGTTIWSPLAFGVLTGKYNDGIPNGSRLAIDPSLRKPDLEQRIQTVRLLSPVAEELNCTMAQLALAWCLKNPFVSTVILGATSLTQLDDNLHAAVVKTDMTHDIMQKIDKILKQSPMLDG